jgi:hypothetical protein
MNIQGLHYSSKYFVFHFKGLLYLVVLSAKHSTSGPRWQAGEQRLLIRCEKQHYSVYLAVSLACVLSSHLDDLDAALFAFRVRVVKDQSRKAGCLKVFLLVEFPERFGH